MNLFHILRELYVELLSAGERKRCFQLTMGTIVYSAVEIGGIAGLFLYMQILMNPSQSIPESVSKHLPFLVTIAGNNLLYLASMGLLIFYVARFAFMTFFSYLSLRFTRRLFARMTSDIFARILNQPITQFNSVNSAQYKQVLVFECNNVVGVVQQFLILAAELLTISFIFVAMLVSNPGLTMAVIALAALTLTVQGKIISPRLFRMSREKTELLTKIYRLVDETFGNHKLLKVNCTEKYALGNFERTFAPYNAIQVKYQMAQTIPRGTMEIFGVFSIVFVAMFSIMQGRLAEVIPTLTFFALAFVRILPSANRINSAASAIAFNQKSVALVRGYLQLPSEAIRQESDPVGFENDIVLEKVDFSYNGRANVLNAFDYRIRKGKKIGIIGPSGVGKSTLADIIMGLVSPTRGKLKIDNVALSDRNLRSWRAKIGYIPQHIYLFDGTVAENVCMGFQYNEEKVENALRKAKILDVVMAKGGLNASIGEQGNQLSGGQKQRLAIARALYNDPDVLVMDEGTSALDDKKEQEIMDSIFDLSIDKTVLIIAHRQQTLARCDAIIDMQG